MANKLTYEYVKDYIESFEGYKLLSTEYINSKINLDIICPKGHKFDITFNSFQKGSRCSICYSEDRQKYTDEELINSLKLFYDNNETVPTRKDFGRNGLASQNVYRDRFSSVQNAYKLANITIPSEKKYLYSQFRFISDEELLNILRNYKNTVGFPTQRKFNSKNNLPAYTLYFQRFGSFRNAILLSEIDIPNDRKKWFNRESLTDEEMLKLLKYYTDKKLENNMYLLTNDEIDNIPNIPHSSTYNSRFGGVIKAYKLIGIDYYKFNNESLENDMVLKYKYLVDLLGYSPTSRDLDRFSQDGIGYCTSTYILHFGTLNKFQERFGYDLTNNIYSYYCFAKDGTKCLSKSEAFIHNYLLNLNLDKIEKEIHYKDFCRKEDVDLCGLKRCDWIIYKNNRRYIIEYFGLMTLENYIKTHDEKIKIIKDNYLENDFVALYEKDLWKLDNVFNFLN